MKAIIIIVLVILVLFLILIYPLRLRVQGHINVLSNICIYSIKVMFISIVVGRCKLSLTNGIDIENMVNRMPKDIKHPHLVEIFNSQLIKRVNITKLDIYFTFGSSTNAYTTAMVCGAMQSISSSLISFILNKNKYANIFQDITPSYTEDECEISTQVRLQLTLLDIIKSFITAKKEYKKLYGTRG